MKVTPILPQNDDSPRTRQGLPSRVRVQLSSLPGNGIKRSAGGRVLLFFENLPCTPWRIPVKELNFGARLGLALSLPWRVLFNGAYAARLEELDSAPALGPPAALSPPEIETETATEPLTIPEITQERDLTPALQLLTILQREGRFVDFLQEEMGSFTDEEIGAAARVVHEGCTRALKEYVKLAPVRAENEGAAIELAPGYNATETQVTGNIVGEPPYSGSLAHHGWKVTSLSLPELAPHHDANIIAPAEVEL